MKKKYAIVTDSTTYFTEEQFKEFNIKRASLNIVEGDNSNRELDLENSYVYEQFDQGKKLTTSQPSPGEYLALYEELLEEGYEKIFVLVISEKLSGTYQSAKIAMNMLDEPNKIHLFDSIMAAYGNEMLLLKLVEYTNKELPVEEIVEKINKLNESAGLIFTSEDLISLIRSGRLSKTKALIGRALRIKPVIKMAEGKLDLLTSARTRQKAVINILDFIKSEIKPGYKKLFIRICSHNSLEYANKLKEELKNLYKNAEFTFSEYIGPVFNVHVGPKGFGVSWMTE